MNSLLDIGAWLVAARRSAGITQAELGKRLGVPQQQVARWEARAYRNVDLERVATVADALALDAPGLAAPSASGWSPDTRGALLAAEAPAAYAVASQWPPAAGLGGAEAAVTPVRDLGEVIARIRAHAAELHERFGVTRIDVFGSFARGEQRPESDVDLLVEVAEPTMETVFGSERRLGEILGRETQAGSIRAINPRVRPSVEEDLVHVWSKE